MKAYVDIVNKELSDEVPCKYLIQIDRDNKDVFNKLRDGVILGKLVCLVDGTLIDEDKIKAGPNTFDGDIKLFIEGRR